MPTDPPHRPAGSGTKLRALSHILFSLSGLFLIAAAGWYVTARLRTDTPARPADEVHPLDPLALFRIELPDVVATGLLLSLTIFCLVGGMRVRRLARIGTRGDDAPPPDSRALRRRIIIALACAASLVAMLAVLRFAVATTIAA